jgi:hypothetical protein
MCWLASHSNDPVLASHVRKHLARAFDEKLGGAGYMPLGLLWLPPEPQCKVDAPKAAVFHGSQPVAVFRTGWDEGDAWFAIKGGTPSASHGHMDVGSFVYDAHGCRWFHDMGADNYNLPAYFGEKRWDYFRMQNRSHNTLEIGGSLQDDSTDISPLVDSNIDGEVFHARFDLTPAYRNAADKVARAVAFNRLTGEVRIEDDITSPKGPVIWRAYTDAQIELRGVEAVLTKKEGKILLRANAGEWRMESAAPPSAEEERNAEYRALVLEYPAAPSTAIKVRIQP